MYAQANDVVNKETQSVRPMSDSKVGDGRGQLSIGRQPSSAQHCSANSERRRSSAPSERLLIATSMTSPPESCQLDNCKFKLTDFCSTIGQ